MLVHKIKEKEKRIYLGLETCCVSSPSVFWCDGGDDVATLLALLGRLSKNMSKKKKKKKWFSKC
jgi:hypothetical protein